MSFFVKSTSAPRPKTKNIRTISIGLAAVLVVMVVAQLFTFETFPNVIAGMWLPGGETVAPIRAAVIVTLEVFALPFLLSMRLSPAMRVASMVVGWMVILAWLVTALWTNLSSHVVANNGMLGDTVSLPVGWWSVLFCISLGLLAAWSAWGMWPIRR
jgi:hypothetical protein